MFRALLLFMIGTMPLIAAETTKAKKIVLIAGAMDKGHPPGTHEYEKTVRLFKHALDNASNVKGIRTEAHLNGWPEQANTLDTADTIVLVSSGSDRNPKDHPLLVGDRLANLQKQMNRGCGLVLVHWSTFIPNDVAKSHIMDWVGGHFDYQSGPAKNGWYSKIQTTTVKATPGEHPISRGMKPFEIKDEFYYNLKFRVDQPQVVPVLTVEMGKDGPQTVAWALEKNSGSRGFGFTGGHFFDHWRTEQYRKMLLNAILWTAHAEVPEKGVISEFVGDRELNLVTVGIPAQVLILTGHDGPFHQWRETSQVLKAVIERDHRFRCRIVDDIEFLAREDLSGYELIVQNYVNWERPGLSDAAKKNLLQYLSTGKGFAVIHFANGAFHQSLPKAGESDWPEYRKIVRRVWDHAPGKSAHDPYGKFTVNIVGKHPITDGMNAFETTDELYFRQQGDEPIDVLATAKSKVTNQQEPLAWVYQYGKARIFQTVLGHSVESIRGDGAAVLIRRGCTWAAQRELRAEKQAAAIPKTLTFGAGKFDQSLDARLMPASVEGDDRYRKPPLTVEGWTKLNSKDNFNVLVSVDPKSSLRHWELYTYAGSGVLSAYFPGMTPSEIKSNVNVADGQWHHVAMTFDGTTVKLWVDAKEVLSQAVKPTSLLKNEDGPLLIGGAYAANVRIGCDGMIDDVRISKIVRTFTTIPKEALTRDEHTISLWKLDGNEGVSADTNWTPPANLTGEAWERENDKDWVDGRFQSTDTGPFQNATVDYTSPTGKGRVYKATAIKLPNGGFLFDRNQLRFASTWSGNFLNHSSRRFGLLNTPTPGGKSTFGTTSQFAGWADTNGNFVTNHPATAPLPRDWAKFQSLTLKDDHVVLNYTVGETAISETPTRLELAKQPTLLRTICLGRHAKPLTCLLAELPGATLQKTKSGTRVEYVNGGVVNVIFLKGKATLAVTEKGLVTASFPTDDKLVSVDVVYWTGPADQVATAESEHEARPLSTVFLPIPLRQPPPRYTWKKSVVTNLDFGNQTTGPLVVDTFNLPYDNPYKALFFVTGVDFLKDGRIAICTAHGDVWLAQGDFTKPGPITWSRYATGLYQPLGLKVVNDVIHVLERGQVTALTGIREAETYRSVNADWHTGGGEHSYDTCLETDPQGNFYFFKTGDDHTPTGGCLLKVTADGSKMEIFSTGFRHPIGLGMSPKGEVSGADQEGNWMPVSRLDLYKPGGFYGDMRTHHRPTPPTTYDRPLLWLPKVADNSSGGQVWVPEGQWGSLGGQMLHLSYGRCKAYAILRDGTKFQAATSDLGLKFLSGSARGRFSTLDHHLYVVGLDGWQTAAAKDGCLQRVRYTDVPFTNPVGFRTQANSITINFDEPLDSTTVKDLKSWTLERWNYRWSANYGSKDWSILEPNREGHDPVSVVSVELAADQRSVTVKLADLVPCMQMKIEYRIKTAKGDQRQGTLWTTINER